MGLQVESTQDGTDDRRWTQVDPTDVQGARNLHDGWWDTFQ